MYGGTSLVHKIVRLAEDQAVHAWLVSFNKKPSYRSHGHCPEVVQGHRVYLYIEFNDWAIWVGSIGAIKSKGIEEGNYQTKQKWHMLEKL